MVEPAGVTEVDPAAGGRDFVRETIRQDLAAGRVSGVVTRFPPEPNGYLHIGHALSICLNFGVAKEFGGRCHLRYDDTNPAREDRLFVDAIAADVRWLGWDWGRHLYHASDHFEQLHAWAVHLIRQGDAYVDDQTAAGIHDSRGTLTEPGRPSPWRDRDPEENLRLFRQMREGAFPDGARVLRARIDMAAGNINLRDPVLYRIMHRPHPRTGDRWCIYPVYDFAHGQSDAIEGVTHSLCTLEFADHRPLYDWLIARLPTGHAPRQYEFARLNVSHTVLSKRHLAKLVADGHVAGWDDPRMPTLSGLRRRGVPAAALRAFIDRQTVSKNNGVVDMAAMDAVIRDHLNRTAPRRMVVLRPLKVIIETWPADRTDDLPAPNHPDDPAAGQRTLPFGREIYIERDDFHADPPRKFFRLAPGREVRLRFAWLITCRSVERDATGRIVALRCTHDPDSRGGNAPDGRKVRGTIHWVAAHAAQPVEVRLYDRLFTRADPLAEGTLTDALNPASLEVVTAMAEPDPGTGTVQFERNGYFTPDPDSRPGRPVFNRTIGLRDSYKPR